MKIEGLSRNFSLLTCSASYRLQDGQNAASLNVAELYVQAFQKLAQKGNTIILPSNVGDVTSAVSQVSINFLHYFLSLLNVHDDDFCACSVVCTNPCR